MSLINEALKRTETDKLDKSHQADAAVPIPLADPGSVIGRPREGKGREWRVWLTIGAIFLGSMTVLWAIMHAGRWAATPSPQATPQGRSPGESDQVTWQGADRQKLRRESSDARIEAALAMQKTDKSVLHYRPGQGAAARSAPVDSAALSEEDFGDPTMPSPFISAARPSLPTYPNRPVVDATRLRSVPSGPARPPQAGSLPSRPTATASPSARRAAAYRPARDPTQPPYELTGIVESDSGRSAIINGIPMRTGQTLGKARVLQVNRHTVVLDVGGRRAILGL